MKDFSTPRGTVLPLIDYHGKPYLAVAHRLVWFREEHPSDWSIETEYTETEKLVCFKATVKDQTGRVLATARKFLALPAMQNKRESTETSAIGRCLALVGYGTQFCSDDLEEDPESISDSPTDRARR